MDDRNIAEATLQTALDVVMRQRKNQHGDAENSFAMIGELWGRYLTHALSADPKCPAEYKGAQITIDALDVSQMMVLLKIARTVYGDGKHHDNYVDQAGYSGLSAMLAGATGFPEPDGSGKAAGIDPIDTPFSKEVDGIKPKDGDETLMGRRYIAGISVPERLWKHVMNQIGIAHAEGVKVGESRR